MLLGLARSLVGGVALLVVAELVAGAFVAAPFEGSQTWCDANHDPITPEEAGWRGMLVPVQPAPRFRMNFAPGTELLMCYPGVRAPWLDEQGCVPLVYSSCSVREREELCAPKPDGQRRVVFLGDSVTIGWGIPAAARFSRLVEDALRKSDDAVRTVNCGGSGTLYVDEYRAGLENRFAAFAPDAVVCVLTVNDLLPLNHGLVQEQPPAWWESSALLRALLEGDTPHRLALDPRVDWTERLLGLPASDPAYAEVGRGAFWAGGGPQQELKEMRDWCKARGVPFGVVLHPCLQGIGKGETYPFAGIHAQAAEFCKAEGIPFLDLLPAFRGHDPRALWVAPYDTHGNPDAQRIAAAPMVPFVARLLGR